jgi:uncharacterized protein (TIGR02996 family)
MSAELLAAIAADPDSDDLRMVYADWLEGQGNTARAELVRVQCELSRIEPEDVRWPVLAAREAELRPEPEDGVEYRRGFLSHLEIYVDDFLDRGAALRARYPMIESVTINGTLGDDRVTEVIESGLMAGVRHLELDTCNEFDSNVTALASPRLANLRHLTLRHFHAKSAEAWRMFVRSPHLAQLTSFCADQCEVGVVIVGEEAAWPKLRRLRLATSGVTAAHVERFAASPMADHLELLALESVKLGERDMLAFRTLSSLRWLSLRFCTVDETSARVFTNLPALSGLEALHVESRLDPPFAAAIAGSRHLGKLARMGMRSAPRGAFQAFVRACELPALVSIDANEAFVTDEDLRALAERPLAARLHRLRLDRNDALTCRGASAIAGASQDLRFLDLGSCGVKRAGAVALATSLPRLERVDLSYNRIGRRGGAWLSTPNHENVRLRLAKCHIPKPMQAQLREHYGDRVEL